MTKTIERIRSLRQHMTLHVERGKGRKDRFALLSPLFLEQAAYPVAGGHAQGKLLEGGWLFRPSNRSIGFTDLTDLLKARFTSTGSC